MKHRKQFFGTDHTVNKLYFTSDNLTFFDEQHAANHARQLKDKTIFSKTRDEVDEDLQKIINDKWEDELLFEPLSEFDSE